MKHDLCPRSQVFALQKAGHTQVETSRIIGKPRSFVERWWRREELGDRHAGGRRVKVTRALISAIKNKMLRKSRHSTRIVAREMNIAQSTVQKVARKTLGLYPYHRAKKLILSVADKAARLAWARRYQNKIWDKVVFSDEKIVFCVPYTNSKNDIIWAPKGTEVLPAPHSRHSAKLNVCAAVWLGGRSKIHIFEENLASPLYIKIITESIIPGAKTIRGGGWELLCDNSPIHTSKLTKSFLTLHTVPLITIPARSPEPNVIENVWSMLITELSKLGPQTAKSLRKNIIKAWNNIPQNSIDNCIRSMPRRVQLLIDHNGEAIKY